MEYLDFEVLPVEKPKPLIKGVLDSASRMIFGGGSKTYKSWCMCDMGLSLACEVPWLGFETYLARVLYVNFELKEYYFKKRLQAICKAKGIKPAKGMFHVWNLRGYQIDLASFIKELIQRIEDLQIVAALIDPFYKLLGDKDERVSAELNPILAGFDYVNRKTGTTIVMSAHYAKGNAASKEPLDRISGGGSIVRDPDALITLTRHENKGEFTADWTVRDFEPLDPFVVQWKHPLLIRCGSDPERIKRPGGRTAYDPMDLYRLVEEHDDELNMTELVALAEEELGWNRKTVYNKMKELKAEKKIFTSPTTGKLNTKQFSAKSAK